MRNTKNKYKYKSYSNKSANINHQYFRNKINEAKKLYIPNYNNISKSKMDMYKINEDKNKIGSSKKYLKFKQILNNYMNDYEKLKKQNKIPEYEEKNYYSYQEFEIEKNNVRELFDSIIDLNGHDEFNDTDKIIQNLPDDFDNMFLKNDATKKDYALRYEIINGEKLEETERMRSKTENNINHEHNINKLNQNCLLENNEEEDDNDENNNININNNIKNDDINKQNNEIKNDNIIEEENINNNIRINKDEEININNNNINQKIEELNNNNIIENNNKIEEEEKNNNENNIEETSKEQNNNNIDEQNTSKNNELNSENKIDEEKNIDNKNETEEKKENEEENNINNEEKKELENEMGQNKFRKFRESEEKEISEDKDKKEESLEKYDDFE